MVETMDELIARVQRQVYRLTDLHEALNGILITETSSDGTITVEVDGNAALTGLSFTGGISEFTPEKFEKLLVETARAAAHRALTERGGLIDDFNSESTR
ncbi:YbaB/EbfC family nucleoid-associated protein [Nocardia jinanensis]|uniref:YbaB/EbfC family nucleoid-associated protein n=1 Tax=Nocardia jinanensis TaxID=382504 RepID=UPI0007A48166|nr:YbaB/EbfC family nucleoid-associated protein [Nocardia jinanensis]